MSKSKPQQAPAQPPAAIQPQPSSAQSNTTNPSQSQKPNSLETLIVIALTIFAIMLLVTMVSPSLDISLYILSLIGCIGTSILLFIINKRTRKASTETHQNIQSNVHLQSKSASEAIPISPNSPQAQALTTNKPTRTLPIITISLLIAFSTIIVTELSHMQPGYFPILTCLIVWFGIPILIIIFIIKCIINYTRKK